jgi:hypothetical protein
MESKIKLFTALAKFQQEVPAIHEGTKGYGYTYADLKQIFKTINPLLKKHDLGFTQLLNGANITTIIFHTKSGETIESTVEIPDDVTLKGMNKFQVTGSAITYYRRYSLSSILGLVTDVDADAGGEQEQPAQPKQSAIQQGRPKVKKWLTDEAMFNSAKKFTADQLEKLFDTYQFRNKEWEEELHEAYSKLKSK